MYWTPYKKALLGLFFPALCPGCGQRDPRASDGLCRECVAGLAVSLDPAAEPLPIARRYFNRVYAPYLYRDPLKRVILKFKYGEEEGLHRILGKMLASYAAGTLALSGYSAITFVPLTPYRRITRGFNQAQRLARHVACQAGLDMPQSLLKRTSARPPQERLTLSRRLKSPAGTFRYCGPRGALTGKDLLLIDDVLTSGATANECARILRAAGARSVDILALARSVKENGR